jgi:hypothetical protein
VGVYATSTSTPPLWPRRSARRRRVRYGGGGRVGREADYLGILVLVELDQVTALLQRRQVEQQVSREGLLPGRLAPEPTTYERLSLLRRELNGPVGAWHQQTGRPHGAIHAELWRVCGGPAAARAGAEELQGRIDLVRSWAGRSSGP